MRRINVTDKAMGCVFGALVGDCLGVTSEFMSPEQARQFEKENPRWPYNYLGRPKSGFDIGESTDDGELTLCLLKACYEKKFDPQLFVKEIIDWKKRGAKGVGFTVNTTLRMMMNGKNWNKVGRELWLENKENASNGSLMRLSPVPAIFYNTNSQFIVSILSSVPTHYNIEVLICCWFFTLICEDYFHNFKDYQNIFKEYLEYETFKSYFESAINISKNGETYPVMDAALSPEITNFYVSKSESEKASEVFVNILEDFFSTGNRHLFDKAYEKIYKTVEDIDNFNPVKIPKDEMGYVVHTLMMGLWAEQNCNSFEEGIQKVVRFGLDADTYGAVAGAILGAKYGFSNIPERYIEPLWNKDKVNKLLGY